MDRLSENASLCTPERVSRPSSPLIKKVLLSTAAGLGLLVTGAGVAIGVSVLNEPEDPIIEETGDSEGEYLQSLEIDSPIIGRWIRINVTHKEKPGTVNFRFMKESSVFRIELRKEDLSVESFALDPTTTEARNAFLLSRIHGDKHGIHLYAHSLAAGSIPIKEIQAFAQKLLDEKKEGFDHEIGFEMTKLGFYNTPNWRTGIIKIIRLPKEQTIASER